MERKYHVDDRSSVAFHFLAIDLAFEDLVLVGIGLVFPVEVLGMPPAFFFPPALRSAANPASAKPFIIVSFPVEPARAAMTVSMFLLI